MHRDSDRWNLSCSFGWMKHTHKNGLTHENCNTFFCIIVQKAHTIEIAAAAAAERSAYFITFCGFRMHFSVYLVFLFILILFKQHFFHQLAIALGHACFVSFKLILLYLSSFNVQYARLLNLIVLKTDNFFRLKYKKKATERQWKCLSRH